MDTERTSEQVQSEIDTCDKQYQEASEKLNEIGAHRGQLIDERNALFESEKAAAEAATPDTSNEE